MLKIENISHLKIHTPEWRQGRLAKFTSSMNYNLMGDKFLTADCVAYVHEKVGEELSGIPAKYEVDTADTRHGLLYEGDAIKKFGNYLQVEFLVTQKLITAPGSRFGSTPDCIVVKQKYSDAYDVETGEVKCYPSYAHFIRCALCETPEQLKAVDRKLYFQVLDQMLVCECMVGWAILYHPDFRAGGFRVIRFRKLDMKDEFKVLAERKQLALQKFDEFRDRLLNLKNPMP